ncbi:hypothetical protein VFPPC_02555 [Pochonia chlamydosporia 170]|uniref:Uncharacterized protein n=1 Tax=Pochonia chlamydosporia 170 TaxID=1380566 RepID=A0A179FWI0_METCM|nr:hypothetical protein VFPPC_02555 [Pochonia chlamydosporia 170]OAQ70015.1 hypothetical protein VFPPC_02555 [Pochonia chlamydosporia 170]
MSQPGWMEALGPGPGLGSTARCATFWVDLVATNDAHPSHSQKFVPRRTVGQALGWSKVRGWSNLSDRGPSVLTLHTGLRPLLRCCATSQGGKGNSMTCRLKSRS